MKQALVYFIGSVFIGLTLILYFAALRSVSPIPTEPYAKYFLRSLSGELVYACESVGREQSQPLVGTGCYDTMGSMFSRRRLMEVVLQEGIVEEVDRFNPMFGE